MKKKRLFIILILLYVTNLNFIIYSQTYHFNGFGLKSDLPANNLITNTLDYSIEKNTILWDSIRDLSEINKPDTADAFPYISSDGLRIYFTQGAASINLYFASRDDMNSPFKNIQILSSNFPTGSKSCWLTNDELEVFFINHQKLYYSSRISITSSFSLPAKVNLVHDNNPNAYLGPSLTPDKSELYLYCNYEILIFIKTDVLTYTIADTLVVPPNLLGNPGQLSKSGLKYYLSLKENFDSYKLYVLDRPNISAQFENLTILDSNINSAAFNGQPTVTSNENSLIFVRGDGIHWIENDLFIASIKYTGINLNQVSGFEIINVFPNPCSSKIKVNFKLSGNALVNFRISDISGRTLLLLENDYCNGIHHTTLNLDKIAKGIYFLNIQVGNDLKTLKFIKTD